MKKLFLLLLFVIAASCAARQAATYSDGSGATGKGSRQPVLVELFTSEGCSSCPPAEKNLAYLEKDQPFGEAEIITLAFHVDYWDDLGWKDRFASPLYTQRQRVYDRKFRTGNIYTPQMVVDGETEFVGSKLEKAEKAILNAVRKKKAEIGLKVNDGIVSIEISDIPDPKDATVYLAIAEDGLSSDVRRGENAGKNLAHVSVVRSLSGIGRIGAGETEFVLRSHILSVPEDSNERNLKVIVFIQENGSRRILGVGAVRMLEE